VQLNCVETVAMAMMVVERIVKSRAGQSATKMRQAVAVERSWGGTV